MTLMHTVAGEFRKALTLPGVWAGLGVGVFASLAICVLNAVTVRSAVGSGDVSRLADTSTFETVFAIMPLGTVGAVIIAVMIMGSEYTADSAESGGSRQILTSLRAVPGRSTLMVAKSFVTVVLVVLMAAIMFPVCAAAAHLVIGGAGTETVTVADAITRALQGSLYWILMGLIALAIAALTRGVLIPLVFLIVNSSLVSFSFLLTKVTSLANWLPDMAGRNLFSGIGLGPQEGPDPLPGAIVMAIWAIGLLAAATIVFVRSDG
ncbi:ABC transporter permease [Actinomycetaceae bacterium L2_0104]